MSYLLDDNPYHEKADSLYSDATSGFLQGSEAVPPRDHLRCVRGTLGLTGPGPGPRLMKFEYYNPSSVPLEIIF